MIIITQNILKNNRNYLKIIIYFLQNQIFQVRELTNLFSKKVEAPPSSMKNSFLPQSQVSFTNPISFHEKSVLAILKTPTNKFVREYFLFGRCANYTFVANIYIHVLPLYLSSVYFIAYIFAKSAPFSPESRPIHLHVADKQYENGLADSS